MNIWILQTGEPLHCDVDTPRPMRAMNLSNSLISKGHNVILWSSSFNHTKKEHRYHGSKTIEINKNLRINLIHSPGYKKNISIARIIDHFILAKNLKIQLNANKYQKPDVIFCGFPPIETSYTMLKWAKENSIPSIIDVKDQWPDIFIKGFPDNFKFIAKFILNPYFYLTKKSFEFATIHCSMTQKYLDWMKKNTFTKEKKGIVIPLTTQRISILEVNLEKTINWWKDKGVFLTNKRRFIFVGSHTPVFDFVLIKKIVEKFSIENIACEFVICGNGSTTLETQNLFKDFKNVIFPGWVDSHKIKVLAEFSSGTLAPYINSTDFTNSIPNKIIDSMALGLPLITSLDGVVKKLLTENNVGFYLNYDNFDEIYLNLKLLIDDTTFFENMSKNCTSLYNNKFDFDLVYGNLIHELELLIK